MFQFYPENSEQIELIVSSSVKAGFFGGLVVDFRMFIKTLVITI